MEDCQIVGLHCLHLKIRLDGRSGWPVQPEVIADWVVILQTVLRGVTGPLYWPNPGSTGPAEFQNIVNNSFFTVKLIKLGYPGQHNGERRPHKLCEHRKR